MKTMDFKPGLILGIFLGIYLVIGLLIIQDYGFTPDEGIEKTRASIALSKYGIKVGFLRFDYEDLGHSQFYGTATSMLLVWADNLLSPWLDLSPGVIMHYGYFITFLIAATALFFLAKLFFNSWIALYTTILFATQPLLFGHAFINPKDIPLLAVFLVTITIGFYIDRDPHWKQGMDAEIDLRILFQRWRQFLVSLPRSTYRTFLLFLATLTLIILLKPTLIRLLSQIITTAYSDQQSVWGIIFTRIASNFATIPLSAYVDKGVTNLITLHNIATTFVILSTCVYAGTIFRKGYRQLPKNIQNRSILNSLTLHLKNATLILAALCLGFAISTRIVAIFAGGIVILFLLLTYRQKGILPLVIYTTFSAVAAYISWPIFWQYGLSTISRALSLFSNFDPYFGFIHFKGEILREYEIPRIYLPHLLTVQFTETLVILSILGFFLWSIFLILKRQWDQKKTKLTLIFLWFFLPFIYIVLTTPVMYNNFRQFLFITPPLFIFAAYAVQFLHDRLKYRFVLPVILSLALIPGILNLFALHPYQYIYFNQFVGGVQGAFRNYDLDYWYVSMKEAMEYVNALEPEGARILVWDVEFSQAMKYNNPDIYINRIAHITEADYPSYQLAVISVVRNVDTRIPEDWKLIHTISRSGATLVGIYEIDGE